MRKLFAIFLTFAFLLPLFQLDSAWAKDKSPDLGKFEVKFDKKEQKLALKANKANVKELLREIEAQTGVKMNIDRELYEEATVDFSGMEAKEALKTLLDSAGVEDWDFGYTYRFAEEGFVLDSLQVRDYKAVQKVNKLSKGKVQLNKAWNPSQSAEWLEFIDDKGRVKKRLNKGTQRNSSLIIKGSNEDVASVRYVPEKIAKEARDLLAEKNEGGGFSLYGGQSSQIWTNELGNGVVVLSYWGASIGRYPRPEGASSPISNFDIHRLTIFNEEGQELSSCISEASVGRIRVSKGGTYFAFSTDGKPADYYNDYRPPSAYWLVNSKCEVVLKLKRKSVFFFSENDKFLAVQTEFKDDEGVVRLRTQVYEMATVTPVFDEIEDFTPKTAISIGTTYIDEGKRQLLKYSEKATPPLRKF